MKKSKLIRVSCLAVALVILTAALAVAALYGSPYDTLKNSIFDTLIRKDMTVEMTSTIHVNGVLLSDNYSKNTIGSDSSVEINGRPGEDDYRFSYSSRVLSINRGYKDKDGPQWYTAYISPGAGEYYGHSNAGLFGLSAEDRNSAQFRFYELLLDALVGDLKNNVTMSSENGIRKISGSLTDNQLPALAKAGIDLMIEQRSGYHYSENLISFDGKTRVYESKRIDSNGMADVTRTRQTLTRIANESDYWRDGKFYGTWYDPNTGIDYIIEDEEVIMTDYRPATRADYGYVNDSQDPLSIPLKALKLDYVRGDAEVDNNGNLLSIDVNAAVTTTNIFDEVNSVDIRFNATFADIGTSEVLCPIPGAESVLTAANIKRILGNEYYGSIAVYFTLNPNGTINMDSITTMWPGEHDRPVPYTQSYNDAMGNVITVNVEQLTSVEDEDNSGGIENNGEENGEPDDGLEDGENDGEDNTDEVDTDTEEDGE
ncbi:MAG: hypothetical protein FWG36_04900 [Oscillospiraceae bacterium]|nr:hypothetical protein [Oscillospiraceae bacterium]